MLVTDAMVSCVGNVYASVGCVNNLYANVEKLDATYVQAGADKDSLLKPIVYLPYRR
jgi:hypothetical protein